MRMIKSILRQGVDLIFFAVTLGLFVAFLCGWSDAGYWLGGCALYVSGVVYNKARIAIWMEDNKR